MSQQNQPNGSKIREWRDWGTFVMTFVIIPAGALVLQNQRMQIEKTISENYISRASFAEEKARFEASDKEALKGVVDIKTKLDEVLIKTIRLEDNQTRMSESLAGLQDALKKPRL